MTIPTESYDESVEAAVARETARRKRVFLAFMGLLLIPISFGAFALSRAPSETQKVVNAVTPDVTRRVSGEITASVTQKVVSRSEPIIRENVSRWMTGTIEPRIARETSGLRTDVTALQTTAQELSTFIADARPQLASLPGLEDRFTTMRGVVDANVDRLQALTETQGDLRQRLDAELEFTRGLSNKVDQLSSDHVTARQLAALQSAIAKDVDSIRASVNRSEQTANSNKEVIASLARRVADVEEHLKKLQDRLDSWESK